MQGNWLLQKGMVRFIVLNLLIAIAYAYGVKLSHEFATLPGTVASVWFPSAMTLALVYLLGDRIILGIICGSTYALTLGFLNTIPVLSVFNLFIILIACASGNVLQPLSATYLIKRFARHKDIFSHVSTVVLYILAAVVSPMISASFGITSLCVTGIIPWTSYGLSWITWWLGSALPHLIFTPTILLWYNFAHSSKNKDIYPKLWEIGLGLSLFLCVSWIAFVSGYPLAYLFLPILIWIVFRYGSFFASLLVSLVSLIAILATANNHGLYIPNEPNSSLLLLQSFMAVLGLTSLILSAVIDEKNAAQSSLKQAMENLESQVIERTIELQRSEDLLKQANLELQKLVNIDGLTQVANRRCFDDRLKMEWERLSRDAQPISLILFDIDYFKRYNDYYGHQTGDVCLSTISQTVKQVLSRSADLIARYGGEEFVVILPNTSVEGAITVAQKLRSAIANLDIAHQNSDISDIVTISLGITSLIPNPREDPAILIKQADIALYRAKQQGRNQFIVFSA